MDTTAVNRTKAVIIAKAWSNSEYKKQLIADPKKVIAAEFAVDIPAGVDVKVLTDSPDTEHLVLVPPDFLPETDQPTPQMAIIHKAWTDPAFKAALLADPRGALDSFLKVKLPAKPALKVVEQTDTIYYIVIPQRPDKLSDSELDQVAGGTTPLSAFGTSAAGATIAGGIVIGGPAGGMVALAGVSALALIDIAGGGKVASTVARGVSTAAHAVSSVAKKIFHGW